MKLSDLSFFIEKLYDTANLLALAWDGALKNDNFQKPYS